ncbi:3-carboxy-cis,cis-muconate cycloisomerase [Streptomyces sp. MZ04]|uniref:3-carboxy-cis,cis-muconate cycloisomerase n=1 Tax=Streptomyces sp. MZ04 TaxID=2559236 RepID=UPI00107E94C3|nr:3-carboxy-cis,cis-muconate cycloisomerase [Streptomyces sp. MZ04]TGB15117.1 3-carboxy-cis,cis-muconate cycloisomerase [Streptomyces sp. MZ04]
MVDDDGRTAAPDTGLLSPVRAGTRIEALLDDRAWLQGLLDAEAALARAQAGLRQIPQWAAAAIGAAAHCERFDIPALAVRSREAANPVVALVQDLAAEVAKSDVAAAEYVHRGSTSQDILDTGVMLVSARALHVIEDDLRRVTTALAGLAERHRDTPMAARTLTQHAVPTTFGLKAAGWLLLVHGAADRVRQLRLGGLPVQLGGAAGTLAGYAEYAGLDQPDATGSAGGLAGRLGAAFARETGLADAVLPWHTRRTPLADLGAVLALVSGALGKIAVDVQSMTRTEVAEVAEPAAVGRGASSAMPHKRNPVLATLIRAAAMQVPLLATNLAQCMLAEDERSAGAWHAEWQPLRECLRLTGGAAATAAELLDGIEIFPERMRANLERTGSLVVSERLAAVLAPVIGRTEAKALLSAASAEAADTGKPLGTVLADRPQTADRWSEKELTALLDPVNYLGAAPELVDRAVRVYRTAALAESP